MIAPEESNPSTAKGGSTGPRSLSKANHRHVELDFGTFDLYRDHVVVRIREAHELDFEASEQLIELFNEHFGTRPYLYLSIRDVAYSVNPLAGKQIVDRTNVVAGAFVIRSFAARQVLDVEKLFYNRPTKACATIAEAEEFLSGYLED